MRERQLEESRRGREAEIFGSVKKPLGLLRGGLKADTALERAAMFGALPVIFLEHHGFSLLDECMAGRWSGAWLQHLWKGSCCDIFHRSSVLEAVVQTVPSWTSVVPLNA